MKTKWIHHFKSSTKNKKRHHTKHKAGKLTGVLHMSSESIGVSSLQDTASYAAGFPQTNTGLTPIGSVGSYSWLVSRCAQLDNPDGIHNPVAGSYYMDGPYAALFAPSKVISFQTRTLSSITTVVDHVELAGNQPAWPSAGNIFMRSTETVQYDVVFHR